MLILIALKSALVALIFVEDDDFLDQIPELLVADFNQDPTGFQLIERIVSMRKSQLCFCTIKVMNRWIPGGKQIT